MPDINTHNMFIRFGKHRGQRVTRLPVDYLEWHINESTQFSEIAKAELKRRGHEIGSGKKIEVSDHAIDRASIRLMGEYLATRKQNEGIYSWLVRVALAALSAIKMDEQKPDFRLDLPDMKLVFKRGEIYPTLITVMKPGYDKQD